MKFSLLLFCALLLGSCKKDQFDSSQIDFEDMPLAVVKASLRGTWQVYETSGGLAGLTDYPEGLYMEFDNNSVDVIRDGERSRFEIVWNRKVSITGKLAHIMQNPNGGFHKAASGIYNDTLVLYDNFPDGYVYQLIRPEGSK